MAKKQAWIGWHFLPESGLTQYTSERVRVGGILRCSGKLSLCSNGLHASARALAALRYAPGPIVCRVELRGERLDSDDKSCARERKCLAQYDATKLLHLFSCWCATRALRAEQKAGREPDKRSWDAIKIKIKWLSGRATDEQLAAAWAAAWAAARAAAWAAARAAAWDAARAAAWDAAWDAQNRKLESMLRKAMNQ